MSRLNHGDKPTRAERKAEKKAAKAVAKEAEFDARQLEKEEKRASRSARPRWRRKRKAAETDEDDLRGDPGGFGFEAPEATFDVGIAPGVSDPAEASKLPPEGDRRKSRRGRRHSDLQSAVDAPGAERPRDASTSPVLEQGSSPHDQGRPPSLLDGVEVPSEPQAAREGLPGARRRKLGMRIRKKAMDPGASSKPSVPTSRESGTQIRPVQSGEAHGTPAESFATLRRTIADNEAPTAPTTDQPGKFDPDDVLILDDPIIEPLQPDLPAASHSAAAPRGSHVQPLHPHISSTREEIVTPREVAAMAGVAAGGQRQAATSSSGLSEYWIGLWVSEDGEAIFIEEDGDGWFAVTVLPDPTTTCYFGPDYPEIQSYRMPAFYAQDEIGEFDGERLSVITVPGLPEGYQSPMMYIYFLTSIPSAEGGGNRFATPDDQTRRVFIVADLELGSVNPWSDRDDIEWIDPSINYYKAPAKLDAYMMRRMSKDDPLN